MPDELEIYVNAVPIPGAGVQSVSTMHALRRDARLATGRDLEDGTAPGGAKPSWLGTIGYLILIEQVGTAVYDIDATKMNPGFDRALTHFGPAELTPDDIRGLRGLRNALAHDYGLVSRGREGTKGNPPTGRYSFTLLPRQAPMIRLGPPWNLNWKITKMSETTSVGIVDLADVADALVDKVRERYTQGKLATDLAGGLKELGARYLWSASL